MRTLTFEDGTQVAPAVALGDGGRETHRETSPPRAPRRAARWAAALAAVLLVGAGGGAWLARSGGASSTRGHASSSARRAAPGAHATTAHVIDMRRSVPKLCRGPIAPGKGHPQPALSQMFDVTDNVPAGYLLGWQLVPYHGAGAYRLGTGGNLLALEPPQSGAPLGFATGTLTVAAKGTSGVVDASMKLANGSLVQITGPWSCGT